MYFHIQPTEFGAHSEALWKSTCLNSQVRYNFTIIITQINDLRDTEFWPNQSRSNSQQSFSISFSIPFTFPSSSSCLPLASFLNFNLWSSFARLCVRYLKRHFVQIADDEIHRKCISPSCPLVIGRSRTSRLRLLIVPLITGSSAYTFKYTHRLFILFCKNGGHVNQYDSCARFGWCYNSDFYWAQMSRKFR